MVFLDLWNDTRPEQPESPHLEKKRLRQETPSIETLTRPKKKQKASDYSAKPNIKHSASSSQTDESLTTSPLDLEELQNQVHAELDFFQGLGMVDGKLEDELEEGEIAESSKKTGGMESSTVASETCQSLPYNRGPIIAPGNTNFIQGKSPLIVNAPSHRPPLIPFPAQGMRPIVAAVPPQLNTCITRPFIPLLPGQPPPPPGKPPPSLVLPPMQLPMPLGPPHPPPGQHSLPPGQQQTLPWQPPPPPASRPLSSSSKKKRKVGYFKGHVGDTLGKDGSKYRLLASQGRGSFSSVFRVKSLQDNQIVVLKVGRSNARRATQRERHFLSQLQFSSGCVRMLDNFEWKKEGKLHICLVLEPLACDLRRLIKHFKGLKPKTIQLYARQLFATLGDLSSLQIIHGDIKPDNILVSSDRQTVKLADFGSSLTLTDVKAGTQALGSRYYRAPELITGKKRHTASLAIDVWALGCVLCEVYTAEVLFKSGPDDHKLLTMIFALCGDNLNLGGVTKREWSNVLRKGYESKLVKQLRDLLISCLVLKPERRIKPQVALLHPFCRC